jgi:16S rRNA (uracil1498-N3)-methyltransferase
MAQRYFLPDLPEPGPVRLQGGVAHHLATVLRVRAGDELRLGDGRGGTANATILDATRGTIDLRVEARTTSPPAARAVHVAFAPPRLSRAEWLFEHGTEVGIAVFWPLWTARTRPQGERPDRWQKIVLAAAGQCDRAWLPAIRPARELAEFLRDGTLPARRFVATAGAPFLAPADAPAGETLLLVGPEGGFEPAELAAVVAAGFAPRGLGPHTLRTETAALVGSALLLAQ